MFADYLNVAFFSNCDKAVVRSSYLLINISRLSPIELPVAVIVFIFFAGVSAENNFGVTSGIIRHVSRA